MSYTYSIPGSATYAVSFDTLESMMAVLNDNVAYEISARDVRDSILTVWYRGVTPSSTGDFTYTNPTSSTVTVGGLTAGTTFSSAGLQDIFNNMLYPYISQTCSITASVSFREFGSGVSTTLSWYVYKNNYPIISINVSGTSVTPTGNNQSGTTIKNATQNVDTQFVITTSDGITTMKATASVTWGNKIYWGSLSTFGTVSSANILSLGNSQLSNTLVQTRNGIDGGGDYITFAWPTSFGEPIFVANGSVTTAWTKVNGTFSFVNSYGYTASYDVWMSNTQQNSPISLFEIKQ